MIAENTLSRIPLNGRPSLSTNPLDMSATERITLPSLSKTSPVISRTDLIIRPSRLKYPPADITRARIRGLFSPET